MGAAPFLFGIDVCKASTFLTGVLPHEGMLPKRWLSPIRRAFKLHAAVRRALRQAWEMGDADKAEKLLRNLARRLDLEAPGVSKSILEGLDEILTVIRLGLPPELRRSPASTNIIESMNAATPARHGSSAEIMVMLRNDAAQWSAAALCLVHQRRGARAVGAASGGGMIGPGTGVRV